MMAACTSSPTTTSIPLEQAPVDTIGLAQFQNWKAQNELVDANDYNMPAEYAAVPLKHESTKPAVTKQRRAKTIASTPKRVSGSSSGSVGHESGSSDGTVMGSESSNTAKAPGKKRISKAAKGAVIGAAGGAVAGAVINKNNRVVGAVIGAVVGAGGGYVVGRKMDKKDGRYLTPGFINN